MKKIISLTLAILLVFSLVGCGEKSEPIAEEKVSAEKIDIADTPTKNDIPEEIPYTEDNPIMIDDISWTVENCLVNGEKGISFNYTNNSDFLICDVNIIFEQKEGLSDEERSVLDSFKNENQFLDEDTSEYYILGYNHKLASPGETVVDVPCVLNGTSIRVHDMSQFKIMEPVEMDIVYQGHDGNIRMLIYDFKGDEYYRSNEFKAPCTWPDDSFVNLIDKPNSEIITSNYYSDSFSFDAYGYTLSDFSDYVESCKARGFDCDPSEYEDYYSATNSDGIKLRIYYDPIDEAVYGTLDPN